MEKTIDYYMGLPYTIELIIPEPEDGWFVAIKELPGCMSQGDTPGEAVEMIREAMRLWIEVSLEDGDPIPEPIITRGDISDVEYPTRCRIINVDGEEVFPGIIGRTPDVSKPHVGKEGLAERLDDGDVRVTLDDGTVLMGYECWWVAIQEKDGEEK